MKQRRVGTLTLGIALIAIGIMVIVGFFSDFTVWQMLKLSPALLIFLGAEILVYHFMRGDEKLRYDGLSVFLVIMLTVVTLVGSMIATPISNITNIYKERSQLQDEANREVAAVLSDYNKEGIYFDNAYVDFYLNHGLSLLNTDESQKYNINLHLLGKNSDNEKLTEDNVAEAMTAILDKLTPNPKNENINIFLDTDKTQYSIRWHDYTSAPIMNQWVKDNLTLNRMDEDSTDEVISSSAESDSVEETVSSEITSELASETSSETSSELASEIDN